MGPVGGDRIRHRFFKNYKAPVSFQSVADLQFYMNEVRRCLYSFEYPPSDKHYIWPRSQSSLEVSYEPSETEYYHQ